MELNFLISILTSFHISIDNDVALVNSHNNPYVNYESLISHFSPEILLFLGPEPQQLGFPIQIPPYKAQVYNKQQYLCAPSLQKLSADKDAKKQQWTALKLIFSIN